jgi:hypothetical protein
VDLREHFLDAYECYRQNVAVLLDGLSDGELRLSLPSPAWYWWQVARVEDAAFALLANRPQVIDEPGWLRRLDVSRDEAERAGTDLILSTDEKDRLSQRIDLEELRAYWDAVSARTRDIIAGLPLDAFDKVIGGGYAPRPDGAGEFWITRYLSGRESHRPVRTPAYAILSVLRALRSELASVVLLIGSGQT